MRRRSELVSSVGGLRRFTDHRTKRRRVAKRVAGNHCTERRGERKDVRRVHAGDPGRGARGETETAKRHHCRDAPTEAAKPLGDLRRSDLPDDQGEKSAAPAILSAVVALNARGGALSVTSPSYNRRAMLSASFQTPAAVILLILAGCCRASPAIDFRVVLGIYGFILGALLARSAMGTEHTMWMIGAAIGGGLWSAR